MRGQPILPLRLSGALAVVMLAQSVSGLLLSEQYKDPLWAKAAWNGNDWVTLLVGVPLLLVSQRLARKRYPRGTLLWFGALAFGVYNYAYYLLGAALNVFFPFYVAAFLLAAVALGKALHLSRPEPLVVPLQTTGRWPSLYLGFVGAGLGIAWLAQWARYVATGVAPDIGPDAFRLVAALDLTLMSPVMIAAAWMSWRRSAWGPLLTVLAAVQGATYTLVLTAGSAFGARAGLAGAAEQIPIWAAFTVCNLAAAAWVLRPEGLTWPSSRSRPAPPTPAAGHP